MLKAPGNPTSGGGGTSIGGTVSGATQGSVLFAGPAGALSEDNANLFYDDANNSLGIGAAPSGNNTVLDLTSTSKAFRLPRISNSAMYGIPSPTIGMMCYNTDNGSYWAYSPGFGFGWQAIYAPFTRPLYFQQTTCEFQEQGQYGTNKVTLSAPLLGLPANVVVELPTKAGVLALAPSTYTVATLPAGYLNRCEFVSDSNSTTLGAIVAGGGSNRVPVNYDGTNWRIG